jgi:hypothetical protein
MSQADLLDQLAPAIHAGRVVVHDSDDPWVSSLRRMFPVRTSGVRWEELPDARSRTAEIPRVPMPEKVDALRGFLLEFGSAAGLGPEDRCVVFGDGATEVAFELPFRNLLELFPLLFSLPQTTYVLTPDASWCFAFTFEEDMYFARSPIA